MGKRKRPKNRNNENDGRPAKKPKGDEYGETFVLNNAQLEEYYKIQPCVGEKELNALVSSFQCDLPTTLRVNSSSQFSSLVKARLAQFHQEMKSISYQTSPGSTEFCTQPPSPIPWYPENGILTTTTTTNTNTNTACDTNSLAFSNSSAWSYPIARRFLRKEKSTIKFQKFLVVQNELGTITRQEAVSMLPPLFMDVQPHHFVLDMCAAPGSKTTQLVEILHSKAGFEVKPGHPYNYPKGFVIANDVDNKRCQMLSHQLKRMGTPCQLVTNHPAQFFPVLHIKDPQTGEDTPLHFDRILCDVPCSGDGTLRKNPDLWQKWTPQLGSGLHRTQLAIASRAFELLKVGGKMVYSTCSLNPIEDEAVVAALLLRYYPHIQLVDVGGGFTENMNTSNSSNNSSSGVMNLLPLLRRRRGISSWKVMDKSGTWYTNYEEVPDTLKSYLHKSFFPPTVEDAQKINLERCFRILPHDQDTGGFFVAVIEKVSNPIKQKNLNIKDNNISVPPNQDNDDNNDNTNNAQLQTKDTIIEERRLRRVDKKMIKNNPSTEESTPEDQQKQPQEQDQDQELQEKIEDEQDQKHKKDKKEKQKRPGETFAPVLPQMKSILSSICEYFGIAPEFPCSLLYSRSKEGIPSKVIFISEQIQRIIDNPRNRHLKLINSGLLVFEKLSGQYRLATEGLKCVLPYLTIQQKQLSQQDQKQEQQEQPKDTPLKRVVVISMSELKMLLTTKDPFFDTFGPKARTALEGMEYGQCIFVLEDGPYPVHSVGWRGKVSCHMLVTKLQRDFLLEVFFPELLNNDDTSQIDETDMNTKESDDKNNEEEDY